MSIVTEAVCWDGVYASIGMYALYDGAPKMEDCSFENDEVKPIKVYSPFLLEDELGTLPGRSLVTYEIRIASIPDDLQGYLEFCSEVVAGKGAAFSWFQFDASFHFDYLLAREVSHQIYYITDREGRGYAAIDDETLTSERWKNLVAEKRRELFDGS